MELQLYDSVESLPIDARALLRSDPLAGPCWYSLVAAHAMPADAESCYATVMQDGGCCAVMPLMRARAGRRLSGLTTPYTLAYQPLFASEEEGSIQAASKCLGQFCRRWPVIRLDAVPSEWPYLGAFVAGLRAAGLFVERFEHFGNWHETVGARSWATYLADRPGQLRTTVHRKLKRNDGRVKLEIVRGDDRLEAGIAAYEAVYSKSWKEPEPYPEFNPGLMRVAAKTGTLRLGILWADGCPAAVQFWLVADGCATVLKLAHDESFKALSPGTVLTAMIIRSLLDDEHVDTLDFGRGDDPFKASWTTQRRIRIGLLLINPWRIRGLAAFARGLAGRLRR